MLTLLALGYFFLTSSGVTAHKVQQGILVVATGVTLEEGDTCGLDGEGVFMMLAFFFFPCYHY